MNILIDTTDTLLTKELIDTLFFELNKELQKKTRKLPSNYKIDLYVVGGASIVTRLQSRTSTEDIDAVWFSGETMRECINIVGDKSNLGHDWCNCDFKRTKSYTKAIITNSTIYREYYRLIVRMVNFDLLLAMKLVSFRIGRKHDIEDCTNIIKHLRSQGIIVDTPYLINLITHYYNNINILSPEAKEFIGVQQ